MEQDISVLLPEERDLIIKKALIDNELLEEYDIDNLVSSQKKLKNFAKKEIQGKCYALDYHEKQFKVFDTYTGEILHSHDFPGNPQNQVQIKYNPDEWESWGTSSITIDLNELNKDSDIPFDKESLCGLTITDNLVYLYNQDLENQKLLANTDQYLFGAKPKSKVTNLPFDMCLSPNNKFLCLINRGEGKVYIYDINSDTFTGEIFVRTSGSNKAINMAILLKQDKIYFTDNVSPILGIYDLTRQTYESENLSMGVLGNIVAAPNENSLYLIITRPEPNLKQLLIKEKDFEEIKDFPLKGELFSQVDDPCDLMMLSPDKKYLFFMTYLNTPVPYTPVITIIDLEKNKAIKRFSIKDDSKPINITFSQPNPVGLLQKSLEELIIEKELIEPAKLDEILKNLFEPKEKKMERPKDLVQVENQVFDFEGIENNTVQVEGLDFTPKKTKHVIISPKVDKYIIEVLVGSFWQKHDIDLTEKPVEIEKINELAEMIRKKLEFYDSHIVDVKNFFENHSLNAVIMREYILEMFSEEESQKRTEVRTAPSHCSNCNTNLLGSWQCAICGFAMEKPEDTFKRKVASFDQLANLQKGNFFILDPSNNFLVEIDQYKSKVWKPDVKALNLSSIAGAYRLENKNSMILDKDSSKIIEVSYKGRLVWEYTPKESSGEISEPSGFTMLNNSNLLIADTGNDRVIETDLEGNLIWEYTKGLYQPSDIQKTYDDTYLITDHGNNRILELSRVFNEEKNRFEFNLVWQYGNALNIDFGGSGYGPNELNKPVSAFKEIDGNYLILDAGNKRVIVVNAEKNIIWDYKTVQDDEDISISRPLRVTRLKNQDLLIVGNNKVIQIMPLENNKIKWGSKIDELGSKSASIIIKESKPEKKSEPDKPAEPIKKAIQPKDKAVETEKEQKKEEIKKTVKKEAKPEPKEIKEENLEEEKEVIKKAGTNQYIKDSREAKEEDDSEEEKKEEIKKPSSNQYIKDARDVKDEEDIEEEKAEEIKKVSARQYIGDSRNTKEEEEAIDEKEIKHEIKKVNASQYIRDVRDNIKEEKVVETPSDQENEKLNALIEEKKKQLALELSKKDPNEIFAKREKLISFPILLPDKENNTVSIINRNGETIWNYGFEKNEKLYELIFSELTTNKTVLITEIDKVFELSLNPKKVIWQFNCWANNAVRLKNGNTLITDKSNPRIIEINPEKKIIWEFTEDIKNQPHCAIRLTNGNTLITYCFGSKIKEITPEKEVVWSFGDNEKILSFPEYSCRLKNGNTLIADTKNSRVIEVNEDKEIVWSYNGTETDKLTHPSYALRLVDGHTFIMYSSNKKFIEIDSSGKEVWRFTKAESS